MSTWWDKYIGIPFKDHGRDRTACDCYGLLRLVYAQQLGKELPVLLNEYESTTDREQLSKLMEVQPTIMGFQQIPIKKAMPFDVLIVRQMGADCHIGIVVKRGLMIHTEKGKNCCAEEYNRPHIKPRIKEAWRYVG